jgi:type IV pilus assembly protein PilB
VLCCIDHQTPGSAVDDAVRRFLANTELFAGMPDELLARVASTASVQRVNNGVTVFEQGRVAHFLFFVYSGGIEMRRNDLLTGRDFLYAMYGPGKSFGEESIVLDDPYQSTAVATEETHLVAIPRDVFRQAMSVAPTIGGAASRMMARRANRLLADKGVRFVSLSRIPFDPEVLRELPQRTITEHKVIPIARRGRTLSVAMVNPHDVMAADEVQRAARNLYVEVVGVTQADYDTFVSKHVVTALRGQDPSEEPNVIPKLPQRNHQLRFMQDGEAAAVDEQKGQVAGEQIIQILNQLVGDALLLDSSDIHIEPTPEGTLVRYRIDGRLLKRPEMIPPRFHAAVITRLKALASMNISERRKPQDGRLAMVFGTREVALRLSTVPTRFGEKCVMRILDRSAALMSLDRIVLVPSVREQVRKLVFQPHGIVLVTGPTGSGKTTTMYSAILERRDDGVNIITIEDPIEYTIQGITQVQYNDAIELGYAEAIKSFLRQDVDIMLIGETRDGRTAQNAMQAALSGHLVVTSFHTNSALSTIYRLQEMGAEAFLIANALAGVVAQRLVRTICNDCRESYAYPPAVLQRIYGSTADLPPTYRGAGCQRCNGTGYRGRTAVVEVLPITEELRTAIATAAPMRELRRIAIQGGMITLRDYSKALLGRGLTTPTEVARVLFTEDEEAAAGSGPAARCTHCGAANAPGNKFCEECGAPMNEAPAAVAPSIMVAPVQPPIAPGTMTPGMIPPGR